MRNENMCMNQLLFKNTGLDCPFRFSVDLTLGQRDVGKQKYYVFHALLTAELPEAGNILARSS